MLEIIILIFLSRHIGKIAERKGQPVGKWKMYTVLAWLAGEIIGICIGLLLFGPEPVYMIVLVGLPCAFAGYHIVRNTLYKYPDSMSNAEHYIDEIV